MTSESRETNSRLDDSEKAEREEAERKIRLQLYVFVIRCISYPFNAKQPNDMTKRNVKVQKNQLESMIQKIQTFLKSDGIISSTQPDDVMFASMVQFYYEIFLSSDRLESLVRGGGASFHDFKEVFRIMSRKRIKSLPEPEGSSKETLLNTFMSKYDALQRSGGDLEEFLKHSTSSLVSGSSASSRLAKQQHNLESENILTKEQLFDMFQGVLIIKKFEHQLLFNALQVITYYYPLWALILLLLPPDTTSPSPLNIRLLLPLLLYFTLNDSLVLEFLCASRKKLFIVFLSFPLFFFLFCID